MNISNLSILLLEDNSVDAILLRKLLSSEASSAPKITHFRCLADTIEALNQQTYDIVLLDLFVPDSRGLNTVIQFCSQAGDLPVVVLTGLDDQDIALQAVACGAQDYLVKGKITQDLLHRTIRHAIERGTILQRLKDSEQRFRGAFEQTFQAMSLLSLDGTILQANQTALQLNGLPLQDIIGYPIWQCPEWAYTPDKQAQMRQAVAAAANGELMRFETQILNAENTLIWVDFSLKPVCNDQGKVIFLITEARDISDRKNAEVEIQKALEQERELNQMKSSFISMVSHEFRTPLSVIQTAADLLEEIELTPEQRKLYFEKIYAAIRTMLQLLDEVLLLGHTESSSFRNLPQPLNLRSFCQELVDMMQVNLNFNHRLFYHYDSPSDWVEADPVLLNHILSNLLSNAIKYSPNGGTIQLIVHTQNNHVTFLVKDSGLGIPKADQSHLFEIFHRASNVRRIQGTGLGLAIVKNCVEVQGGQIAVTSEEGKGTTFTVALPLKT